MNTTQIEFPAYNIFFRQDGMWMLYGSPLVQKTYKEVQGIAHDLLFSSNNTDAVRIYGIFQCQMNFISESKKKDLAKPSGSCIAPESAIKTISEVVDSMYSVDLLNLWYQTASKVDIMGWIEQLRKKLANALKQITDEERKQIGEN